MKRIKSLVANNVYKEPFPYMQIIYLHRRLLFPPSEEFREIWEEGRNTAQHYIYDRCCVAYYHNRGKKASKFSLSVDSFFFFSFYKVVGRDWCYWRQPSIQMSPPISDDWKEKKIRYRSHVLYWDVTNSRGSRLVAYTIFSCIHINVGSGSVAVWRYISLCVDVPKWEK